MINVAILGFGVVGSGVLEVINKNNELISKKTGDEIRVKRILDIRDFDGHEFAHLFTKNFDDILNDKDISVVAEVIGGVEPSFTFTKKALSAGKSVVTSNKELVAKHGAELIEIAIKNNVHYMFEASVGGAIPILRPLNQCLAANCVEEIYGIVNGTTNYILTQMFKNGQKFEDALSKAQEKGYAESNPSADVDGIDACRKIAIMMSIVTGKEFDCDLIETEGITKITSEDVEYAEKLGCKIKLVAYGKNIGGKAYARVSPLMLPATHPLGNIEYVYNGVLVKCNMADEVMFYGKGAGKLPTASAVVADIIDISINKNRKQEFFWEKPEDNSFIVNSDENVSRFFVRMNSFCEDDVKTVFKTAQIISDKNDKETAFVTEEIEEKLFNEKIIKLSEMSNKVISVIRKID